MTTTRLTAVNQRTTAACRRCASLHGARAAPAGSSRALSGAIRATRGAARASRHSPRLAAQRQSRLANTAHSTSRLLARQQSVAPACSGRCGAAVPPPRPVDGAGERRHGLPPAEGGAHFPKEAQDAPAVYAALCSAAHGPRHTKPTLTLAKRLSAEGLAARTRLHRGHALRPGERATESGGGSPSPG